MLPDAKEPPATPHGMGPRPATLRVVADRIGPSAASAALSFREGCAAADHRLLLDGDLKTDFSIVSVHHRIGLVPVVDPIADEPSAVFL